MTLEVYTDQIWNKSRCRDFEKSAYHQLRVISRYLKQRRLIRLVDIVTDYDISMHKNIITDNVISSDRLINKNYVKLYPEFWGSFSYQPEYINRIPTKLFNCFINRVCIQRQTWFYYLIRRNLLNQGSISFLLDYRNFQNTTQSIANWSALDEKQHLFKWIHDQIGDGFTNEYNQIKSQVPYSNFNGDLDQTIVDTKISLVIETYFDGPSITFSEKIFRALQLPRPILMYNVPGSIKVLQDTGFDLYADIINHAEYDCIKDPNDRMIKIFDILEGFKNFTYTEDILLDFENRAKKNRELLINLKLRWPDHLKKIEEQIITISNNESSTTRT